MTIVSPFKKTIMAFSQSYWNSLALCLGVAFFIRVLLAWYLPGAWRPDEFFQYLEPAHRLSYGTGIITWEWRVGIRSWLVPGFFALLMDIGQTLGIENILFFIRVCLSFFSLCVPGVFFWYGWRKGGALGAWTLGAFGIFWPDIVNGSIRSLGEFLGGNTLLVGVVLILAYRHEPQDRKSLIIACIAGLALGITSVIRFQLAPAAGLAMIFLFRKTQYKQFLYALLLFTLPVLFLGFLDFLTLGQAFQSVLKNFYYNETLGIANQYGKEPTFFYIVYSIKLWICLIIPLCFCLLKARQEKYIPLLIAGFIIFYHSLISHKEISFIYAAILLIVFVAACGCFEIVRATPERSGKILGGLVAVMLCSFIIIDVPILNDHSIQLRLQRTASQQKDACGLALLTERTGESIFTLGGYSITSRKIPLYAYLNPEDAIEHAPQYNYIIISNQSSTPGFYKNWDVMLCTKPNICLYHKLNQPCVGAPDFQQFSNTLKALENSSLRFIPASDSR